MPSDFNRKGPQNKHEQDLVNTLGNPLASEEEWLHANEKLGDFKPKQTATDQRRSRHLGEVVILAAMGLGIFGLINFTQPSNLHPVVKPAQVGTVPASKTQAAGYDVDFGPYMADLQRNIKHNWNPPKKNESKRVVVIFKVSKDGRLSQLKLDRSSGDAAEDQAAFKAVRLAEPEFGALPEGAPDSVDIQFTFDYNVFNRAETGQ